MLESCDETVQKELFCFALFCFAPVCDLMVFWGGGRGGGAGESERELDRDGGKKQGGEGGGGSLDEHTPPRRFTSSATQCKDESIDRSIDRKGDDERKLANEWEKLDRHWMGDK